MKKTLKRPNYAEELLKIIQSPLKNEALLDRLNDYHERDIADALELLSPQQRKKLYPVLGAERLAEIFSYLETPTQYLSELSINQAAKMRYMTGGQATVPMVLRLPMGAGRRNAGQHSQCFENIFCHTPGLKVVAPSSAEDAKGLLKSAIRDEDPVIFIEHKLLYAKKEQIPEGEYTIPLGVADVKREGTDITIVTWSREVYFALEAAEELAKEGISAEVLDLRTLVPLDWDAIVKSVSKTHNVIVLSEEVKRGSYAAEISAQIAEELFDELDAPVERVCGLNIVSPFSPTLEDENFPHPADIVKAVKKVLNK